MSLYQPDGIAPEVRIDVDLNRDGKFAGAEELNYEVGFLGGEEGENSVETGATQPLLEAANLLRNQLDARRLGRLAAPKLRLAERFPVRDGTQRERTIN